MSEDISTDPFTVSWKAKGLARGLPETLLNEMIAQANAEYNSEIGYQDFHRLAMLTVHIIDGMPLMEAFYRITVNWGGYVFHGQGTAENAYTFTGVPCVPLHIEVFKVTDDGTQCIGYGYALFNHSKDEEVWITINNFAYQTPAGTYVEININDGYITVHEHLKMGDALLLPELLAWVEELLVNDATSQALGESLTRSEDMVKTN